MRLYDFYATQLADLCSEVSPLPVSQPHVALVNTQHASELGLRTDALDEERLLPMLFDPAKQSKLHSVAQKYGGHQFGHWNPQLGDGRGLLLGEIKTPEGKLQDLHLKGAGPTPYSRHADGRAVLRSTIREYLGSEAMHALGIPSSRSLCLITSHEPVMREKLEPGAMMIRTCPSHIRFGHFEYFHHSGEKNKLDALFDFCLEHHYLQCKGVPNPHLAMLNEIVQGTAVLVAKWQAYGFNHGVMNTDNMSIHGITFDYGPYAFLDDFIPNYICNHSDHSGRYAFDQQPSIALWNLNALAHGFSQYIEIEDIKSALSKFEPLFLSTYQDLMQQRFGFCAASQQAASEDAQSCIHGFMQILRDEFADYHIPFRQLAQQLPEILDGETVSYAAGFKQTDKMKAWCLQYSRAMREYWHQENKLGTENTAEWPDFVVRQQQKMLSVNPKYVLRNHHLQQAIEAAEEGDFSVCEALFEAITHPFEQNDAFDHFAQPPSADQKGIALSCSS